MCYLDVCLAQRWHDFFPGVSSDLISESLGVCHCGQYPSNVFGRSRKLADARGVKLADDQLCYSVLTEDGRLLSLNPLLRKNPGTAAVLGYKLLQCHRTKAQSSTFKGHRTPHSVTGREEPKILRFPFLPAKNHSPWRLVFEVRRRARKVSALWDVNCNFVLKLF